MSREDRFKTLAEMYAEKQVPSTNRDPHSCVVCSNESCECGNWCGALDSCCCTGCDVCTAEAEDQTPDDDDVDDIDDDADDLTLEDPDDDSDV